MDRQISEYLSGYQARVAHVRLLPVIQPWVLTEWRHSPPETDWERGYVDAYLDALN